MWIRFKRESHSIDFAPVMLTSSASPTRQTSWKGRMKVQNHECRANSALKINKYQIKIKKLAG